MEEDYTFFSEVSYLSVPQFLMDVRRLYVNI